MNKAKAVGPQKADRGLAVEDHLPLILAFSLGEERGLWPAWKSKAALTHLVAGLLAQRGASLSPRVRAGVRGTAHGCSRDSPGLVSPFEKLK